MEIISHRGYWKDGFEKNKQIAFERSFSLGLGTETDLRDSNGHIVISHDMPTGNEITLSELFIMYKDNGCEGTLALNIKADGLQKQVAAELETFGIKNYFLFDMSVPDCLVSLKDDLVCFARYSEYEPYSLLWERCQGIWYDSFHSSDIKPELIEKVISKGKRVCIVSPELHNRDHLPLWEVINKLDQKTINSNKIILCTDIPEAARDYFHGK